MSLLTIFLLLLGYFLLGFYCGYRRDKAKREELRSALRGRDGRIADLAAQLTRLEAKRPDRGAKGRFVKKTRVAL